MSNVPYDISTQNQSDILDQMAVSAGYPDYATLKTMDPMQAASMEHSLQGTKGDPNTGIPWGMIATDFGIPVGGFIAAGLAGAGGAGMGGEAAAGGSSVVAPAATHAALAGAGGAFGAGGIGTTAVNIGAGIASGAMQAHEAGQNRDAAAAQQDKQLAQQKLLTEEQLAQSQKQFDATQAQGQSNQALNATQMDPFKQAKGRENLALLSALLNGGSLNAARQPGQLNQAASFISPGAMQAQEGSFNANAAQASGGKYIPPDQSKLGYLTSLLAGRA